MRSLVPPASPTITSWYNSLVAVAFELPVDVRYLVCVHREDLLPIGAIAWVGLALIVLGERHPAADPICGRLSGHKRQPQRLPGLR